MADRDGFRTPNGHHGKSDTPGAQRLRLSEEIGVVQAVSGPEYCQRLFVNGLRERVQQFPCRRFPYHRRDSHQAEFAGSLSIQVAEVLPSDHSPSSFGTPTFRDAPQFRLMPRSNGSNTV